MLFIRADYAKKQSCKYSVFVTFQYNPNYVELIKRLKYRSWDPNNKEWEIGQDSYEQFIDQIRQYDIPYNVEEFRATVNQLKQKVAKMQAIQKTEVTIDTSSLQNLSFKTKPRDYQLEGIAFGLEHNKFLLADEQGLGKTLQAINIALLKKGGKHCLIITGYKTLLFNWVEEIRKHSDADAYVLGQRTNKKSKVVTGTTQDIVDDINNIENIKEFFLILSISSLRQCNKIKYYDKNGKLRTNNEYYIAQMLEEKCRTGEIGRIIFDEAQVIKNHTSNQSEATQILRSAPYKILATGTPLMNKHIDLFPLMSWLGQTDDNFYSFRDKYCVMGGYKGKQIIDNKNGDLLNAQLKEFMLRRKKEDVLDLPDKIYIDEKLEMELKQATYYEQIKKMLKADLAKFKGNKVALLGLTTKLRQITDYPAWLNPKYTDSIKFDRVEELLANILENNQKVIIFSNWETPIFALKERLEKHNLDYAMITGATKDRMGEVKKFQENENCSIILGTIGAMGVGLTLTAASNIIFLDEPWNRALKDQAVDRAHRIGTKTNVNVYTLICKNTIDEKVHRTVMKKGIVADNVVDGLPLEELEKLLEEEMS